MSNITFFNTDLASIQTYDTDSPNFIDFKHKFMVSAYEICLKIFQPPMRVLHLKRHCIGSIFVLNPRRDVSLLVTPNILTSLGHLIVSHCFHSHLFSFPPSLFSSSCIPLISTSGTRSGTILHIKHSSSQLSWIRRYFFDIIYHS